MADLNIEQSKARTNVDKIISFMPLGLVRLEEHLHERLAKFKKIPINKLVLVFSSLIISFTASASKEGILPLSDFIIKSDGIGGSGSITVIGGINERGVFTHLSVEAFGKTIKVSQRG